MKKILTIKLLVLFFIIPNFSEAKFYTLPSGKIYEVKDTIQKWFTLPSGLKILAEVQASELTLEEQIVQYIYTIEDFYEFPRGRLLRVAKCESNLNPNVYGDKNKAYGLFQFWFKTFEAFKKEAGMSELEYKNWRNQTELAGWAFDNGKQSHWVCK